MKTRTDILNELQDLLDIDREQADKVYEFLRDRDHIAYVAPHGLQIDKLVDLLEVAAPALT